MKPSIRYLTITSLAAWALAGAVGEATAQTTVNVDPASLTNGFMNVFDLSHNFQFNSTWGLADLTAVFAGSTLTLGPNHINDPSSYWYTPGGGPGALGNKIMDANIYNETTGMYVGTTLTFTGNVLSDTLASETAPNGVTWTSVAFIKDFAPDYSSSVGITAPLTPGAFSISLATSVNPGDHIQYGFETIGSDIWSTDVGQFGTVVIAPVPEPTSLALLGLGAAAALAYRRRR